MNAINGVEEVNIFKDDGAVIHIRQPKSTSRLVYALPCVAEALMSSFPLHSPMLHPFEHLRCLR